MPAETPKVAISRVCVKASPAFGGRRLHTNTDHIDIARERGGEGERREWEKEGERREGERRGRRPANHIEPLLPSRSCRC